VLIPAILLGMVVFFFSVCDRAALTFLSQVVQHDFHVVYLFVIVGNSSFLNFGDRNLEHLRGYSLIDKFVHLSSLPKQISFALIHEVILSKRMSQGQCRVSPFFFGVT